MLQDHWDSIFEGMQAGRVVPYLGPGVLKQVHNRLDGKPLPADDEALILALNLGKPLNPRLMIEFPRAAMHIELKRGRKTLTTFLSDLYESTDWSTSDVHQWLFTRSFRYVIDTNRDITLQKLWHNRPHTLVVGIARLSADPYRFRLWENAGTGEYREIALGEFNPKLPILFKPLGTPRPEPTFIASDADFVDYITELMGGFAIPAPLKEMRIGKQYLILGLRLVRDTQRMVLSDLIYDAGSPAGWALIPNPTAKERRYCASKGIEIIEADVADFLQAASDFNLLAPR